jgi:hypothetical protein
MIRSNHFSSRFEASGHAKFTGMIISEKKSTEVSFASPLESCKLSHAFHISPASTDSFDFVIFCPFDDRGIHRSARAHAKLDQSPKASPGSTTIGIERRQSNCPKINERGKRRPVPEGMKNDKIGTPAPPAYLNLRPRRPPSRGCTEGNISRPRLINDHHLASYVISYFIFCLKVVAVLRGSLGCCGS